VKSDGYTERSCAYSEDDCRAAVDVYVCKDELCNSAPDKLHTTLLLVVFTALSALGAT